MLEKTAPFITCEVRGCLALLTSASSQGKGNTNIRKREGDFPKQVNADHNGDLAYPSDQIGLALLSCLNEAGVAQLWLLRGLSVSAYMAPPTESSHTMSRNPAGLSEFMVAGRALEDNISGLIWQLGTCQVAEWLTGLSGMRVAFLVSVDISRFRSD